MTNSLELPSECEKKLNRLKIVFFVKPGLDAFLNPVVEQLSRTYCTLKVVVKDMKQIDEGMKWADICWFEWCDDLVIYGSRLSQANNKKVICRLHSYEAFTNNLRMVYWETIDRVIFVGKPIKDYVLKQVAQLKGNKTIIIENGVDLNKFTFRTRKKGFKIAYVGYINYKKGPMLLLHAFKAVHEKDPRYTLHIAGTYQDRRYALYFNQMIEDLHLTDSIKFDGWQSDVNQYLEDKDYIISTSLFETQHMSVMEGMAKGLKPLVHNFYGAKEIYDASYVWSTINELVDMVTSEHYFPKTYRLFIEKRYTLENQMGKIKEMMQKIDIQKTSLFDLPEENIPKITVGIINYNYSDYLEQCLESVLKQTYPNLEIIFVDDCSTDGSLEKISGYEEKYGNIRAIFHEENLEMPDIAMQEIFQEAKGEYVLLLSADDFLLHDKVLEDYFQCLVEQQDLDYVYGNLLLVDKNGKTLSEWNYKSYNNNGVVKHIFQRGGSGVIPMVGLFKLSFYRDNNYSWIVDPAKPIAGDTLNCLINIKRGWKHYHLNKPALCYRKHDRNLSYSGSYDVDKRIKSMIYLMEYIIREFSEEVYLPHIKWDQLAGNEYLALKKYTIGQFYWKMVKSYLNNIYTKHLDHEAKKKCVKPLLNKVNEYFQESLTCNEIYKANITAIEKEIATLCF